jgi:hypothetical protein
VPAPTDDTPDRRRPPLRWRRNPAILERRLDDTLFLVHPVHDSIFYLNALSAGLWRLLAEPISIAEAQSIVQQAFPDTPTAQIAADVSGLIHAFDKKDLIRPIDEDSTPGP